MKLLKKSMCLIIPIICVGFLLFKKKDYIKIGIIQIIEHESLDNARQGFIDELENLGYKDDEKVQIETLVAGGDLSNCQQIIDKYINDKKDLILAISTPCAQTAANSTKEIPIVATSITSFERAGLVEKDEMPNTNVTGTSDLAPIDKIIELVPKLNPNVKKVGVLYSNSDDSPKYQAEVAENEIKKIGLEAVIESVSQLHEVPQVVEKLAEEVDALYVPVDKNIAPSMPQISQTFLDRGKFVVCAEDTMISKGAIATYGINFYKMGQNAGKQAFEILENNKKPSEIPIEYPENAKLNINYDVIERLRIKIPDDLK